MEASGKLRQCVEAANQVDTDRLCEVPEGQRLAVSADRLTWRAEAGPVDENARFAVELIRGLKRLFDLPLIGNVELDKLSANSLGMCLSQLGVEIENGHLGACHCESLGCGPPETG